jgi:8-oxoguanine deaminase
LTCAPVNAWFSIINGRMVIEQGEIIGVDLKALVKQHNEHAERLLRKAAVQGN